MENQQTIILLYLLFIWLNVLHIYEEIAQDIFSAKIGSIKMSFKKYLVGAGIITTVNIGTLALIVSGSRFGLYIGIFTSSTIGVLQALVHTIGYFKEGRKAIRLGAGFCSSIPLSAAGAVLLVNLWQTL